MIRKTALILFLWSPFVCTMDTNQDDPPFQTGPIAESPIETDQERGLMANNASSDIQPVSSPYLQVNLSKRQTICMFIGITGISFGIGLMLSLLIKKA